MINNVTIMAKYKELSKDYKNFNLLTSMGIVLSRWREKFGANQYGEFDDRHKQLSVGAVANAIGERYEGIYRVEHGGGTTAVLIKYLMFIRQHDSSFDLDARLRDIMGEKYPEFNVTRKNNKDKAES